jgi:hypothetical protein
VVEKGVPVSKTRNQSGGVGAGSATADQHQRQKRSNKEGMSIEQTGSVGVEYLRPSNRQLPILFVSTDNTAFPSFSSLVGGSYSCAPSSVMSSLCRLRVTGHTLSHEHAGPCRCLEDIVNALDLEG